MARELLTSCGPLGLTPELACTRCAYNIEQSLLKMADLKNIKKCQRPFDKKHKNSHQEGRRKRYDAIMLHFKQDLTVVSKYDLYFMI
jgi:hypothetical protein